MNNSENLIREVNEAMRQERLQNFLGLFGKYIIGLSCLVLLATIGYVWWQSSNMQRYQDGSAELLKAIDFVDEGRSIKAKPIFDELAKTNDEALSLLAGIWQIKLKYLAGKKPQAIELASEIQKKFVGKKSLSPYYDWLQLSADPAIENATYKFSAMEMQAANYIGVGKNDEAQKILQKLIAEPDLLPTIRERIKKMQAAIADSN